VFKSFQRRDFSQNKANSIQTLPLQDLAVCNHENYDAAVQEFFKDHALASKSWFYPQALAHVGKWSITRSGGLFSGKEIVKRNCITPWDKGLYWVLMSDKRALAKQYLHSQYCALTPLILSAFKTMQGINYREWEDTEYVINPSLLEAASTIPPEYSKEELIEFRVTGLTTQTGKDAGQTKSPISTYGIYGLPKELPDGRPGLGLVPQLTRIMLLQTWCAHPSNRSKYSILDPRDWDNMPEPLIDEELIPAQKSKLTIEDLW
jgi:hypothetical protein